jgi:signal transduction histidine kinase
VRTRESRRLRAAKVAIVAAAIVMACYLVTVLVFNLVMIHRLTAQADGRLAERLNEVGKFGISGSGTGTRFTHIDHDENAPIFIWEVSASGLVTALTAGAPSLPHGQEKTGVTTVDIAGIPFRVKAVTTGSETLVAGESVGQIARVRSTFVTTELIFGSVLFLLMFSGSFIVGLRASASLEWVRRRQMEFTADASHEVRTPLSVIEAEVDLALERPRSIEEYRSVLQRVAGEGRRLRGIVDDLRWLALADDRGMSIAPDVNVDVTDVAETCADRFRALATARGVDLSFHDHEHGPLFVHAETEWIDRLIGILIDNACKYAGPGGRASVRVCAMGNRVVLQVDDNGPGIPPDQRKLVLDRFHRADENHPGTGLGLAIADSVVRATQGTWLIAASPDGGARMQVSWRKSSLRRNDGPAPDGRGHPGDPSRRLHPALNRSRG